MEHVTGATLLVATRKGLFTWQRNNDTWRLTSSTPDFPGEPVSMVLHDARDGTDYAALNLGHFGVKLWCRPRDANEWTELPPPAFAPQASPDAPTDTALAASASATTTATDTQAPSVDLLWSLEAAGPDAPGVLWAGTIPGGLFRSDDHGRHWQLVQSLWDRPERAEWMGGGYDHAGIHSICIDPHDSRQVMVAVSTGGVWRTRDGGDTWALAATGMEADYMPPERRLDPNAQDVHRLVQCRDAPNALWAQHHNGIFRTLDYGTSWRRIQAAPSSFGFAVAVDPHDPDVAWFAPAQRDACRIPVDARLVVTRTRDGGESFTTLSQGLPDVPSYDLIYRHGLDIDATGSTLAMGSTTGALWIGENAGEQWQSLSTHLPPIYAVRFV
ncbi:sialidase [Pandoraea sp. ISTKB]|uniref:VPS10 domain-containing protein n=1 Tax=Pandoraea sp. ISTKB TaxID=1586708 RepID=UPI0008469D6F|nr:sialidase [Pandoraea sp. ISTKB]ODP31440.1 sialidase [Pandoraea sp. ISTKB]